MKKKLNKIVNYWYEKNFLMYFLVPVSFLYRFVIIIHRWMYRSGFKKSFGFALPIIVIGNITVGGTGKTPLVIALAKLLSAKGYKPGIVSRGYKAKTKYFPLLVTEQSDPIAVGDEALLLKLQTNCPVVIAPNRAEAVQLLLQNSDCNIVLCDDGLQHHRLKRDMEIVLIDGERHLGNGFCLPAGPLREPKKRLSSVDFVIFHASHNQQADFSHNKNCTEHKDFLIKTYFTMTLQPGLIYNLMHCELKFSGKSGTLVHAVTGIGNPKRFFDLLRQMEFEIIEHIFPDHYQFKRQDFSFGENAIVVMTEKDATKCHKFAQSNYWVLPVNAHLDNNFIDPFFKKLVALQSEP
jgi:tetraacyldisaccharide 4'-kinase